MPFSLILRLYISSEDTTVCFLSLDILTVYVESGTNGVFYYTL